MIMNIDGTYLFSRYAHMWSVLNNKLVYAEWSVQWNMVHIGKHDE